MFRCSLALLAISAGAFAQRPFTAADTVAVHNPGELSVSPVGKVVLFSVDGELLRVAGGEAEPWKAAGKGAASVRWSPDGSRIAYFREHALWTLDVASGKVTRICDYQRSNAFLSKAGNMLAWSPDGRELAFAGTLEPPP